MIYDLLENRDLYTAVHPGVARGLKFLAETDLNALADGRVELDGDRVFASVQSYDTKPANVEPEAHRAYIDIQYVFQGREMIGVAPLKAMTEEVSAHPERDVYFYHGPTQPLTIGDGRVLILWPADAHGPGVAPDGIPAPVRKCVVKVLVEC